MNETTHSANLQKAIAGKKSETLGSREQRSASLKSESPDNGRKSPLSPENSMESTAIQIGRDDYKAFIFTCPFEAWSDDAKEWLQGQRLEADHK